MDCKRGAKSTLARELETMNFDDRKMEIWSRPDPLMSATGSDRTRLDTLDQTEDSLRGRGDCLRGREDTRPGRQECLQKPAKTFRNLQKPSETFGDLQKPSKTFKNI